MRPHPLVYARKAIRIFAVVGVVAASAYVGSVVRADHVIDFTDCSEATPSVTEPTLTPPPVDGEPTPEPPPSSTPPPQNCVPAAGERIWGTRTLEFSVDENSSDVDKVTLSILSQEENIPSAGEGKPLSTWPPVDEGATFSFDWNSFEATPYNGIYKIVVIAHSKRQTLRSEHNATAERVNLRVDNAPRPVDPPSVLATTLGSVTLEWPRALEPDVTAYTVYRATTESKSIRPAYADFKQVGVTTGPAYRDSTVKPGVHWYSVRVTRRSVITPDVGISSPPSLMSGPAEVKSPNEVPTPKPGDPKKEPERRFIPFRQPQTVRPQAVPRGQPDAPFAYKLPYDTPEERANFGAVEEGADEGPADPRGAVLPVAVGMFLVSSALAVGRMPY